MHMQKERIYIVQEPSRNTIFSKAPWTQARRAARPGFRDMSQYSAHFDGHDESGVVAEVQDATAARKQNL